MSFYFNQMIPATFQVPLRWSYKVSYLHSHEKTPSFLVNTIKMVGFSMTILVYRSVSSESLLFWDQPGETQPGFTLPYLQPKKDDNQGGFLPGRGNNFLQMHHEKWPRAKICKWYVYVDILAMMTGTLPRFI